MTLSLFDGLFAESVPAALRDEVQEIMERVESLQAKGFLTPDDVAYVRSIQADRINGFRSPFSPTKRAS